VGRDDNDAKMLQSATNSGTYSVTDDLGADWNRVQKLVTAAQNSCTG